MVKLVNSIEQPNKVEDVEPENNFDQDEKVIELDNVNSIND